MKKSKFCVNKEKGEKGKAEFFRRTLNRVCRDRQAKGNEMLIPKFEKELSPKTKIVSYIWRLKGWEPVKVDPLNAIYMYLVPDNRQGV